MYVLSSTCSVICGHCPMMNRHLFFSSYFHAISYFSKFNYDFVPMDIVYTWRAHTHTQTHTHFYFISCFWNILSSMNANHYSYITAQYQTMYNNKTSLHLWWWSPVHLLPLQLQYNLSKAHIQCPSCRQILIYH